MNLPDSSRLALLLFVCLLPFSNAAVADQAVIQKTIAESYDIRLADMTSRKRPANIAFARQVAMYLARELTGSSYQEIGDAFGGRDHGTIMHACRQVADLMDYEHGRGLITIARDVAEIRMTVARAAQLNHWRGR